VAWPGETTSTIPQMTHSRQTEKRIRDRRHEKAEM
jgi:hypothetical protein